MYTLERGVLTAGVISLMSIALIAAPLGIVRHDTVPATTRLAAGVAPGKPASELDRIRELCQEGEFAPAEAVAAGLADGQLQGQILQLIIFSKARYALSRQNTAGAERVAADLPVSLKRSLVLIAVASQQASAGERRSASANLREGGDMSSRQRSRLLASAARVYMRFDPLAGQFVLRRAVAQYRSAAMEPSSTTGSPKGRIGSTRECFYEIVQTKSGQTHMFPLNLPSLPSTTVDESVLDYLPNKENRQQISEFGC